MNWLALMRQTRGFECRDGKPANKPYRDSKGKLTIGIGRNLDDVGISDDEAVMLCQHDVLRVSSELAAAIPWIGELEETRQAVLYQMAFQMGTHGLMGFKNFLTLAKEGRHQEAAAEMLRSKWAEEDSPSRAHLLSVQFDTGEWQYAPGT